MHLDEKDSQVMNYLVRMVVPMRREFGRQLDVRQFLHDFAYAREVLDEALKSADARLVDYARYVETRLTGPRIANAVREPARPAPAPELAPSAAPAAAPPAGPTADEMRARIMRKYTEGLR
jgi:hypothetical protein